jgi:hypothetical protein
MSVVLNNETLQVTREIIKFIIVMFVTDEETSPDTQTKAQMKDILTRKDSRGYEHMWRFD